MRIHVVADETGKIIAAAHASATTNAKEQTGFFPLAGQKIVEIDVPHVLVDMEPHDRLCAILKHRVQPDGTCLEPTKQQLEDKI